MDRPREGVRTDMVMDARRSLPSVDVLLRHPEAQLLLSRYDRPRVVGLMREVLGAARDGTISPAPSVDALVEQAIDLAGERWRVGPIGVINASGVILHTNLGRAPVSRSTGEAVLAAATGYSALEFDLHSGGRGSRHDHLTSLLREVTGAEDGVVVNNNAAGLVLTLAALCRRREVILSRGQAVEIGGGFRIPAIMRESGARLVEVGTTNKTRLPDYAEMVSPRTAALLRVHSSNFRIVGFTEEVALADLVGLARAHDVLQLDDVGSGALLDVRRYGLRAEPLVTDSVRAGCDVVLFSGDKLLGGPQAGVIVGRAEVIGRLRRHSLMRALRPDKMTIAGLAATLAHYLRGEAETEIPVWRMIAAPRVALEARARAWMAALQARTGVAIAVVDAESTVGGGSLPGETLPTCALSLAPTLRSGGWANALIQRLRTGATPVVARVDANRVLMDPRTVLPDQDAALVAALAAALNATT